ncbi:MAG: hypothetical protein AAF639_03105 [Chloroflexota bacterium]
MHVTQNHSSVKTQLVSLIDEQPDDNTYPQEPPCTPEGDLEALAELEEIRSWFPPLDAESARYFAESEELSFDYRFQLELMGDKDMYPQEPPRTPEGDLEGLAVIEEIRNMFPPSDPETAYYFAESEELSLDYRFQLELMGEDG